MLLKNNFSFHIIVIQLNCRVWGCWGVFFFFFSICGCCRGKDPLGNNENLAVEHYCTHYRSALYKEGYFVMVLRPLSSTTCFGTEQAEYSYLAID